MDPSHQFCFLPLLSPADEWSRLLSVSKIWISPPEAQLGLGCLSPSPLKSPEPSSPVLFNTALSFVLSVAATEVFSSCSHKASAPETTLSVGKLALRRGAAVRPSADEWHFSKRQGRFPKAGMALDKAAPKPCLQKACTRKVKLAFQSKQLASGTGISQKTCFFFKWMISNG